MKTLVQARLDEETQATLDRLVRRHGWTTSKVVREGIRLVEKHHIGQPTRMIGIGMFASGTPDMGSNKKYLEGLGGNSGIGRRNGSKPQRKAG